MLIRSGRRIRVPVKVRKPGQLWLMPSTRVLKTGILLRGEFIPLYAPGCSAISKFVVYTTFGLVKPFRRESMCTKCSVFCICSQEAGNQEKGTKSSVDWTKPIQTRSGTPVRFLGTRKSKCGLTHMCLTGDEDEQYLSVTKEGLRQHSVGYDKLDVVNVPERMVRLYMWAGSHKLVSEAMEEKVALPLQRQCGLYIENAK